MKHAKRKRAFTRRSIIERGFLRSTDHIYYLLYLCGPYENKLLFWLIDCKHFNFGDGNCPFGTSCFYKHTVKPGSYTWIHRRPPPRHRQNNYDMHDVLDMLGEADLSDGDLYSIIRGSDLFDEMDPYEMMAISDILGNGSGPCPFDSDDEDEDLNILQMASLTEALVSGVDDFGPEDFDDEFEPYGGSIFVDDDAF